ncbi:toxin-antitoxin system YwqK family antitoxin [Aureibaculum luteum]|uniref:toxin-antitoxin system YwqK family antitoxin n=1 Tax=Aureibaculum luteum TaxID=1548456 RepID=UPI000E4B85D6|nr:hypothetical protein [Aureibaculum luteum]
MNIRVVIILLFVFSGLYAQESDETEVSHPVYGKAFVKKIYNDNAKLLNKLIYTRDTTYTKGNFEIGEWIHYYENGKIKAKGTYVNLINRDFFGRRMTYKTGEWLFYTDDGKLTEVTNYKNDKRHGKYIYYHSNGNVAGKGEFNEDKLVGKAMKFFENGQLHRVINYKDGMAFNVTEFYDKNGKTINFGTLKDGNGTIKIYDLESGMFLETMVIKDGYNVSDEE